MRANKHLIAAAIALTTLAAALPVHAQSEASGLSAVSALPVASVAASASVASGALSVPVILSGAGAVFVVKAIEVTASSTAYVLERVSDGARISVELTGQAVYSSTVAVGSTVAASVISAGVILSAANKVIAFIPNASGRALLCDERLTY